MFQGLPKIYIGPDKERPFFQPSGTSWRALEQDMRSMACQLPVRYKNSMWKEAGPYITVVTAVWILSSEDTTHSLSTDLENRRKEQDNSHHSATDKDGKTNAFKILPVQPKNPCLC